MLRGEYVVLRTPEDDDCGIITAWENDRDVSKYLPFSFPISKDLQSQMIHGICGDEGNMTFIIENEDGVPIGICSLVDIDWINSTSGISIALYAKNCWGRGYGYDAVNTLTRFGIEQLNLFTVYAGILEGNERAVKCFQKAGYEIEGVLFDRFHKGGQPINLISMSLSKRRISQD